VPESTAFSYEKDLGAVRDAIDAASGRLNAAEALKALAGIRQQLEQCIRLTEERMAALTWKPQDREAVVADTDQPRTVEGLARAFEAIGRGTIGEDAALSTDPDDYPLF
jgi:hypothetical protein